VNAGGPSHIPRSTGQRSASEVCTGDGARLTPLREAQLIEAYKAGDADALAQLLEAYQRRIFGVCYRMLGNADEAADLTQDSIIRVIEGLETYERRSRLSTWVIRVTMNCCLTHLRKQRLRRHQSLDGPASGSEGARPAEPVATGELTAAARIEQSELQAVLLRALSRLEPDMRAVLVLRDLQELEYLQIGEVLGLPVGTVKSRLFRARMALRAIAVEEVGE
jgi:RNA polymerase sigma-70 factor (ECF subfamily)